MKQVARDCCEIQLDGLGPITFNDETKGRLREAVRSGGTLPGKVMLEPV